MKRFISRTCTFAVPDAWEAEPPAGFGEPGEDEDRLTAQVLEHWVDAPVTAAAYAETQKRILPEIHEGYELLDEGVHAPAEGEPGYRLTFRAVTDDGDMARLTRLYLAAGSLVCELTLTGLDEEDAERDRVFAGIARNFALHSVEFLSDMQPGPVVQVKPVEEHTGGPRAAFPRCCISVRVPEGWGSAQEGDECVLQSPGSTEIRVRRVIPHDGDVGTWYAETMQRVQDSGSTVLGGEKGCFWDDREFAALRWDPRGLVRTWGSAADRLAVVVFVDDVQPLEWTLRCHGVKLADGVRELERTIAATSFLPPAQWETRLLEPWVDLVLKGGWKAPDEGLYVRTEGGFLMLALLRDECSAPLAAIRKEAVESIRKGFETITRESEVVGGFQGAEALSFVADGTVEEQGEVSVRATWLLSKGQLHTCIVQGIDRAATDALLEVLLGGVVLAR